MQVVSTGNTTHQSLSAQYIRRSPGHEFLSVGFPLHTSRSNNKQVKQVISVIKFGYPNLTLNDGPKVKSEHIRRFLAHDSLEVGSTLQTSGTKNKWVISTFNVCNMG